MAQWLAANRARVKSWVVAPDYLGQSIEWYLQDHPEILASRWKPQGPQMITFPPVPDALIIGRRHHLQEPDKAIAGYRAFAGRVEAVQSIAGFEIYARNLAPEGKGVAGR